MKNTIVTLFLFFIITSCGQEQESELDGGAASIVPFLLEGAGRVFESSNGDFGPIILGGAVPAGKNPMDLTGGVALNRSCIHKNYKSTTGLSNIVDLNYCIEADVKLNFEGKGSYISNIFIEVLDDLEVDITGSLIVKAEIIKVSNIGSRQDPVAKVELMVTSFFDGIFGDLRATDRFVIYGNKSIIEISKVGKLK